MGRVRNNSLKETVQIIIVPRIIEVIAHKTIGECRDPIKVCADQGRVLHVDQKRMPGPCEQRLDCGEPPERDLGRAAITQEIGRTQGSQLVAMCKLCPRENPEFEV